ncbi:MAG: hypothetical protein KKH12_16090 [Gammaproteobacteria bacterium]|nr:hypothetical protein [Gammaproteobacteria bacterium]
MQVSLPTGLKIEVRGMKIREERVFADKRLERTGQTVRKLVEACTEEIIDYGPYSSPLDWDRVAWGDIFKAGLAVRAATHGAKYKFEFSCPECGARQGWQVDILEGLDETPMDAETAARFIDGNEFTVEFDDGLTVVHFKIPVAGDAPTIARNHRTYQDAPISGALLARIIKVIHDGREIKGSKALIPWLQDQPLSFASELVDEMEEFNCGVDTTIDVGCKACGAEIEELDLPFDERFWVPARKQSKKSRRRR